MIRFGVTLGSMGRSQAQDILKDPELSPREQTLEDPRQAGVHTQCTIPLGKYVALQTAHTQRWFSESCAAGFLLVWMDKSVHGSLDCGNLILIQCHSSPMVSGANIR